MHINGIKAVLELIPQQFIGSQETIIHHEKTPNSLETLYNVLKEVRCSFEVNQNDVQKLFKNTNDEKIVLRQNEVKNCIYQCLKVIFSNTTQEQRLSHFNTLIVKTYDNIIQKLLELQKFTFIPPYKEYKIIVRSYIPLVKLDIVLEKQNINTDEIFLLQALELKEYLNCPEVLREDVYEILNKKFVQINFELLGYNFIPITTKLGYLGSYAKLQVYVRTKQEKAATLYFFMKFLPGDNFDYLRQSIAANSFIKEEVFYSKFIPLLVKLGMTNLDFLPQFYLTTNNFLVLEDITMLEYSYISEKNLKYDHISVVVKDLARLHSCSIILERKLSEQLNRKVEIDKYFPNLVAETSILDDEFHFANVEHAILFLEKYTHIFKDITLEEFRHRARNKLNQVHKIIGRSAKYNNVLNHGDMWAYNIFYKWNDETKPEKCILLDYQLVRYSPQILDILMLTYIAATKDTRDTYMSSILQDYYNNLKDILEKHDIDIESVSPYKDLLNSLEDYKIFGIYVGTCYTYWQCLPKSKMDEIDADPEKAAKYWTDYQYRGQIIDSVWNEIQCHKKFEENVQELYDLCMKDK